MTGLFISKPETLLIGLSLGINFMATLGLQVTFNVDAAAFLNLSIATTFGVRTRRRHDVSAAHSRRRMEHSTPREREPGHALGDREFG